MDGWVEGRTADAPTLFPLPKEERIGNGWEAGTSLSQRHLGRGNRKEGGDGRTLLLAGRRRTRKGLDATGSNREIVLLCPHISKFTSLFVRYCFCMALASDVSVSCAARPRSHGIRAMHHANRIESRGVPTPRWLHSRSGHGSRCRSAYLLLCLIFLLFLWSLRRRFFFHFQRILAWAIVRHSRGCCCWWWGRWLERQQRACERVRREGAIEGGASDARAGAGVASRAHAISLTFLPWVRLVASRHGCGPPSLEVRSLLVSPVRHGTRPLQCKALPLFPPSLAAP